MPSGCIFCAGLPLTVEDILPKWMQPILIARQPKGDDGRPKRGRGGLFEAQRAVHTWPTNTPSVRLRDVCATCNGGWMSRIERNAKVLIEPMIAGERLQLSLEDRMALARWVALKGVLICHARSGWASSEQWVRTLHGARGDIPEHWRIRLGRVRNASNAYFSSSRLNYEVRHLLAPFPLKPIGLFSTIVAGEFVGQLVALNTADVRVEINRKYLTEIWPPRPVSEREVVDDDGLSWPPQRTMRLDQARKALGDPREPRG